MEQYFGFSRHALERSSRRSIPQFVAEVVLAYGFSMDAGEGARKYSLAKESMRQLRHDEGASFTKTINAYRRRNIYVVAAGGRVITVACASKSLFH